MSDIRFNRWLHQSGTGGVYQDSSGNIGIGTSTPTAALDIQSGSIKIGTNTLSTSGLSTFNNVVVGGATTALVVTGNARVSGIVTVGTGGLTVNGSTNSITGITTVGVSTVYVTAINDGPLSGARNIIINGSMVVNQRGWTGAAGTTTHNSYAIDRFVLTLNTTGAVSAGQTSMNSTVGGNAYADGFQNALYYNVTTGNGALSSGQYSQIVQRIEGFNLQGIKKGTINALPVTLSFWCRSTTIGTYIIELYDNNNTRHVCQSYTINVANTWEKKVLTFPADTSGAFNNDNGYSFHIAWWLAAGSTYSSGTLPTTWSTYSAINEAPGQVNLLASTGNNFWLTGVQLEVGSVATPFERRSYGQELALCQRYFQSFGERIYTALGTGNGYSTNQCYAIINLPVSMRSIPTLVVIGSWIWNDWTTTTATGTLTLSTDTSDVTKAFIYSNGTTSGITAYRPYMLQSNNNANSRIQLSSEL